ncbi:MAG TPA: PA14 domain-containing protein, partial [Chitinophagaceae bacterium]
GKGLPADSFATVATTRLQVPAGIYEIGVTADDYIKLFVGGKETISGWTDAELAADEDGFRSARVLLQGNEEIRVVHAERSGLAALMFYLRPVKK